MTKRGASRKPVIGIPMDAERHGTFSELPHYAVRLDYPAIVHKAGGIPLLIPFAFEAEPYLSLVDGFMLPGSCLDVNPALYGQQTHPKTTASWDEKDAFHLALCRAAVERNIPFLGICAGHQYMNVAMGGTLIQDIPDQVPNALRHSYKGAERRLPVHDIRIEKPSKLHDLIGKTSLKVNSSHHQAVDKLAPCFRATATTSDGVNEAFEHPDLRFCLGVQWHIEFETNPEDLVILQALIASASGSQRIIQPKR